MNIKGSQIPTPSGAQTMTIINEYGLYSLVLSSKLPIVYQNELMLLRQRNVCGMGVKVCKNLQTLKIQPLVMW